MFKVLALVVVSIVGGLYTAVIMPEVTFQANHLLPRLLEILSVGSLLALVCYSGCWLYYRALLFQVHSECRRFLVSIMSRKHDQHEVTHFNSFTPAH
jgi:hypothetical protein